MSTTADDWQWLQDQVRIAAVEFGDQLLSISDTGTKVPNLAWDVAELAAHLISLPKLYREQNQLTSFEPPSDWTAFSHSVRDHISERDAGALADMVVAATDDLIDECSAPETPRTLYGQATNGMNTVAGMLSELKLHGLDLARLTGAEVVVSRRQAVAGIKQQMSLGPVFVDQDKARACDGVYHLHFRGGDDYTYLIDDGVLVIEPTRPARADAHLNADPVAFLLLSLGRMSQVKAGLLGKVFVYGRKPWKMARLNTIVVDGV